MSAAQADVAGSTRWEGRVSVALVVLACPGVTVSGVAI